jgi:glycosyltransferase involved in cell wall biosynthesis
LKTKHLHIVCLDVPYPADYGGVVDLFYKLEALQQKGIRIHMHCFEYGRGKQAELNKYCEKVYYYPRAEGHKGFSFSIPYIVASRNNTLLWERLQKDNYPVLLEGIHCCYGLNAGLLNDRRVVLRLHNVEHEYYKQLSKWEQSLVKKTYFHHESRLLQRFEKEIANKATVVTVSEKDMQTYKQTFGAKQISYLPVFTGHTEVLSEPGSGNFALYQGNLSVAENEKAATWLLTKVFNELDIPFVIAGKNPPERLVRLSHKKNNTCIVANPTPNEMDDLIKKAQLHVMPSFTNSGIKLKLINALFNGRHVITNDAMIEGTGLENLCHQANNAALMKYHIYRLFQTPFPQEEINRRKSILSRMFNREQNAEALIRLLFE